MPGRKITYGAVRDETSASQAEQDIRVNLAHEGSQARLVIRILDDYNPRFGNRADVLPPVRPGVIAVSFHRRIGGKDSCRGCVANERRKVWKNRTDAGVCKPRVSQTDIECFNRACNHTRAQLAE